MCVGLCVQCLLSAYHFANEINLAFDLENIKRYTEISCSDLTVFAAFVVRLITKRFIGEYDQNKGELKSSD